MSSEIFCERIVDLARHLQVDRLPINEAMVCSFAVDDDCWIHMSYADTTQSVHWTSAMCCIEGLDASALCRVLLSANLDDSLLAGGCFSLDAMTQVVVYRYHEPAGNLSAQRFLAVYEQFAQTALYWCARIQAQLERLSPMDSLSATIDAPQVDFSVLLDKA